MRLIEKLNHLQNKHLSEWLKTRQQVADEFSNKQAIVCLCGRLASGWHESQCKKLSNAITQETVKRLKHLLIKSK